MNECSYQLASQWIKGNLNEPFVTIIYVATLALVVKVKNILSDNSDRMLVEVYTEKTKAPFTKFFMPRICIVEQQTFEDEIKQHVNNLVLST